MDALGKFFAKTLQRFQSLPPSRRLAIGGIGALILVTLALLFHSGSGTAEREYLFGGQEFSRDEINAIETAFGEASLADWKVVGYRIEIPANRKAQFLAALGGLVPGIDGPTETRSFFESERDRAMREKRDKQQIMARVVGRMPGIQDVSVQYTESKSSGFPRTVEKRAVAAVQAVGGRHLDHQEVNAIQTVIVASEAGLPTENVVVLDINAKRTYDGSNDVSEMPAESVIDGKKRIYEDRLQQQIRNRLVNYPGLVVEVSVQPAVAKDQGSESVQDSLSIQGIAVSIGVPSSYYERLWNKRQNSYNPNVGQRPSRLELAEIESETLRKVEEIVRGLLNEIDLRDGRQPNVIVRTDEDFASTDQVAQTDAERMWAILSERGQPLLLALLALVGVVLWLGFSRKKKTTASESDSVNKKGKTLVAARRTRSETGAIDLGPGGNAVDSESSDELQDQLSRLVHKDPDAAVDALRKWIRKVA